MILNKKYSVVFYVISGCLLFIPGINKCQTLNYKIESLFVYNFTKYIEWPNDKLKGNFVIGIFGDSPMKDELGKFIASKKVGELSIEVKVINSKEEAASCEILFIPITQCGKLNEINGATKGKATLIVTEKPGLITKGAGISIFLDEEDDYKTKFELNKLAINGNGMQVSANLMQLAYRLIK